MQSFFHSVRLDEKKCKGCTNCIKRCPTEAIRVRHGKASITPERCIDCGECIRVCPYHAKRAETDPFNVILNYKYRIALPAPALYGQFNNLDDVNYVLTALKKLGFDDVFEVARGAELVSQATARLMKDGNLKRPVLSSACPAIARLIRVRFPKLVSHVLPLNSPMEEAGRLARIEAKEKTGFTDEEIGVFFISPCPAKITSIKAPICIEKSSVNGAFAIKDLYPVLVQIMDNIQEPDDLAESGLIGVSWASSGGEAAALIQEQYLAADGIQNAINVLEEMEDEKLNDLDYIELNACSAGCVGGPLTLENPYVAKTRILRLRKYLPISHNHLDGEIPDKMFWEKPLEAISILRLADDVVEAMSRLNALNDIHDELPKLDCGTCGSPSCRALAEDIVRGIASIDDCVFIKRDMLDDSSEAFIPAPFRKRVKDEDDDRT